MSLPFPCQPFVLSAIPVERWRNGRGITRTLAAEMAPGNGVSGWRISVAEIEQDGAYSVFPGMSRLQLLLQGRGLSLKDPANPETLQLLPHTVLAYDGAIAWEAHLHDGPVSALNVMTRTGEWHAEIDQWRDDVLQDASAAGTAAVLLLLAGDAGCEVSCEVSCEANVEAISVAPGSGLVMVTAGQPAPIRITAFPSGVAAHHAAVLVRLYQGPLAHDTAH